MFTYFRAAFWMTLGALLAALIFSLLVYSGYQWLRGPQTQQIKATPIGWRAACPTTTHALRPCARLDRAGAVLLPPPRIGHETC
jgi:hypothetical protein